MKYEELADEDVQNKTANALRERGYKVVLAQNADEALASIKSTVPSGASVMNGASVTLEQIGYIDYLKSGQHPWQNLHEAIVNEKDPTKQTRLRREALLSDYYLGSVHALTQDGEFLIASNTGSQLPHIVYSSPHLVFVVSAKKIVTDLTEAMQRIKSYVVPLEDKHMREKYGVGTHLNKIVFFLGESETTGRDVTFILVNEKLGF